MRHTEPKFSFSIQLSLKEKERLEQIANAAGNSRAGFVQHLVRQHLNHPHQHQQAAA